MSKNTRFVLHCKSAGRMCRGWSRMPGGTSPAVRQNPDLGKTAFSEPQVPYTKRNHCFITEQGTKLWKKALAGQNSLPGKRFLLKLELFRERRFTTFVLIFKHFSLTSTMTPMVAGKQQNRVRLVLVFLKRCPGGWFVVCFDAPWCKQPRWILHNSETTKIRSAVCLFVGPY